MAGPVVLDRWTAWRDDRYFTKNPDVIRRRSGSLLCTFCLDDQHMPFEQAHIVVIESTDEGRTWSDPRVIAESWPRTGDAPWITPRISRLSDDRLVIICDTNDFQHVHEKQPPGIYAWWSTDDGLTWSEPQLLPFRGIEPDRIRELPTGELIVGSHYMFSRTHRLGQVAYRSGDGGRTWSGPYVVGSDRVHHYCEGVMVPLRSGRIACIMRENNHANYPAYISFSEDGGRNWSRPVEAPFSGDRPFAEQLADGRVLVTYRNTAGRPGLFAWLGDIEREHGYRVALAGVGLTHAPQIFGTAGPAQLHGSHPDPSPAVTLHDDMVTLDGERGSARYCLLPPESEDSRIELRLRVRVAGPPGQACGVVRVARVNLPLTIYPDGIALSETDHPMWHHPVDMTSWRTLDLRYGDGLWQISVDGAEVLRRLVYREGMWERTVVGLAEDAAGRLDLSSVDYSVDNPTEPDHRWSWTAADGALPNQYEVERWSVIDYNTNPRPDHGYSTWIPTTEGTLLVLDYTNKDAPPGKAYVVGYSVRLDPT